MKYKLKPIEVTAKQYITKENTDVSQVEMCELFNNPGKVWLDGTNLIVETEDAEVTVYDSDWICMTDGNEFIVYDDENFKRFFEKSSD